MKSNHKKKALTFGDFIAATYLAWGALRAKGFVRLAANTHLVVFRGQQRFVILEE
jgi:hypothetical protein